MNAQEQATAVKILASIEILEDIQAQRGNEKGLTKKQLLSMNKSWDLWKDLVERRILHRNETENSCHYKVNRDLIRKSFNVDNVKMSIFEKMTEQSKNGTEDKS